MSQNAKHIGKVFQGVAGILTALTVLATVIFTLLGVFGVVDMQAVQTEGPALALGYVVAVGAFALSPLVAVGIVAVGVFNAIGIVAISAGSARGIIAISGDDAGGIIAISAGGRASGLLIGIGEEARGMFTVAYSGRKSDGLRALAALVRQRHCRRLIPCPRPGAARQQDWRCNVAMFRATQLRIVSRAMMNRRPYGAAHNEELRSGTSRTWRRVARRARKDLEGRARERNKAETRAHHCPQASASIQL